MEPTPAERVATGRIRYYLLCRHGACGNGDLLTQTRDSAKEYPTDAIALRRAETLADFSRGHPARGIRLGAIVHAETKAAKPTAEHIADTLTPLADEDTKYSYVVTRKLVEGTSGTHVKAVIDRLNARNGPQNGNPVLAVGHQPQLSWIADEVLNGLRQSCIERGTDQPPRFTHRCGADSSGHAHVQSVQDRSDESGTVRCAHHPHHTETGERSSRAIASECFT